MSPSRYDPEKLHAQLNGRLCEKIQTMMGKEEFPQWSGLNRCLRIQNPSLQHFQFSSVAQSCPTLCDPHGLQHGRLSCPSPIPGACLNSWPSQ